MIDYTGTNLGVIIECDFTILDHWMSFASWYSFYKTLPDAQVALACKRGINSYRLYNWAYRLGAKCFQYSQDYDENQLIKNVEKLLILKPSIMAIRPCEEHTVFGPLSVKDFELSTLVDFSEGCGSFVVADWIDNVDGPFRSALTRFATNELTANELKVLRLWEQMTPIFNEAKT